MMFSNIITTPPFHLENPLTRTIQEEKQEPINNEEKLVLLSKLMHQTNDEKEDVSQF